MKKFLVGLLCCLLFIQGVDINAQEIEMTQVTLEEVDISMMIPITCYLLGQNIAENDPYLEKVGGDREKIKDYYKDAGIILNAIAQDDSYEIVVTMNENSNIDYVYSMQSLSEEQISEFAETIQTAYASYGYKVNGYRLYDTEEASYVLFHFTQLYDEKTVECYQYYTIRESRIYNITLRSYLGEITTDMEEMIRKVIDSISFGGMNQGTIYQDKESGVDFHLAEGWNKIVNTREEQYVQAQYMHTNELGESIQFFCMDLWGNMNTLHQLTTTREELTITENTLRYDKKKYQSYISGFFMDYQDVTMEKIGNYWYITSEKPLQVESDSIDGVYLQKSAVTVRNGILYAYQYGYYEEGNLHEADYLELIQSVTYQEPQILLEDGQYYKNIAGLLYKMTLIALLILTASAGIVYLYYKEWKEEK
ncbi:MAG: hypothetical protein IJC02_10665 [Lachnospiraceae bacterium]|nr:hypothetical protein [Lachnospiraceae bacterium]MBQ6995842.1 hypothetical protein [Lachnospiraceae bacterium]